MSWLGPDLIILTSSGATTGTGGRIRDIQAAGRGGHVVAGTAGYCFGNLHIPGETLATSA